MRRKGDPLPDRSSEIEMPIFISKLPVVNYTTNNDNKDNNDGNDKTAEEKDPSEDKSIKKRSEIVYPYRRSNHLKNLNKIYPYKSEKRANIEEIEKDMHISISRNTSQMSPEKNVYDDFGKLRKSSFDPKDYNDFDDNDVYKKVLKEIVLNKPNLLVGQNRTVQPNDLSIQKQTHPNSKVMAFRNETQTYQK